MRWRRQRFGVTRRSAIHAWSFRRDLVEFVLVDVNGGTLTTGDTVRIETADHGFLKVGCGHEDLAVANDSADPCVQFTIQIGSDAKVRLITHEGKMVGNEVRDLATGETITEYDTNNGSLAQNVVKQRAVTDKYNIEVVPLGQ